MSELGLRGTTVWYPPPSSSSNGLGSFNQTESKKMEASLPLGKGWQGDLSLTNNSFNVTTGETNEPRTVRTQGGSRIETGPWAQNSTVKSSVFQVSATRDLWSKQVTDTDGMKSTGHLTVGPVIRSTSLEKSALAESALKAALNVTSLELGLIMKGDYTINNGALQAKTTIETDVTNAGFHGEAALQLGVNIKVGGARFETGAIINAQTTSTMIKGGPKKNPLTGFGAYAGVSIPF